MKIYNSLTRKKEEFKPLEEGKVKMYACGVTVYDYSHIGHARQAIVYSMIAEYLRYRGYDVKYVRNYTDVDDKIIARANKLGVDALEFSKEQIKYTEEDMEALHVKSADVNAKASENIQNIINLVQGLIDKGYAYPAENGDVYYIVRKFKDYGKLSNRKIDELLNGVRIEVGEEKRDPLDFALWKSAKPGEISWDSPWGKGRPGWHIECSAMALNELGEQIDIHGGGKDLIFPHHENEIAQSEAYTGKEFAKVWSHCGLVRINGEKMSKSLGNFITIRDALKQYNYEVIKYLFLQKHYTTEIDILDSDFKEVEKHLMYFYSTLKKVNEYIARNNGNIAGEKRADDISPNIKSKFVEYMDDDFNTVASIAELFGVFKYMNKLLDDENEINANTLAGIVSVLHETYSILGLFEQEPDEYINYLNEKSKSQAKATVEEIEALVAKRNEAKANKDYELADKIREEIDSLGYSIRDTRDGTEIHLKA